MCWWDASLENAWVSSAVRLFGDRNPEAAPHLHWDEKN
jgi:hypothetical protein